MPRLRLYAEEWAEKAATASQEVFATPCGSAGLVRVRTAGFAHHRTPELDAVPGGASAHHRTRDAALLEVVRNMPVALRGKTFWCYGIFRLLLI
jgi:hypothetical protein